MNAVMARLRSLDPKDEKGLSLSELVVTIFVTGILLTIVGTMFVNVARVTANSSASTMKSTTAATLMDALSQVIRTASDNPVATSENADPAIIAATATGLTLYSYANTSPITPSPTKFVYRLDASGNLFEDRYSSTSSAGYWVFSTTAATRALGGPIQALAGTDPLFIYLDADNKAITPGSTGLTLLQRGTVASIKVTVRIANDTVTGSDPIVITSTVGMPNLKISRTDN